MTQPDRPRWRPRSKRRLPGAPASCNASRLLQQQTTRHHTRSDAAGRKYDGRPSTDVASVRRAAIARALRVKPTAPQRRRPRVTDRRPGRVEYARQRTHDHEAGVNEHPRVIAHQLAPSGAIPNHPRWPLLVYPNAVCIGGADPAAVFETLFERNGWPAAWRNGIHPFHHFHCRAHEALGVYSGEATVLFGGEGGVIITARPGNVLPLPARTGHKKLASRGALGIVGAYPAGQRPD